MELTHFNTERRAHMVDVSDKPKTVRIARAQAAVRMHPETMARIRAGTLGKGDVLAVAQVAGILAAKRTAELIPMCHPVALTGVDISFRLDETVLWIFAQTKCTGETGVEMEALTAASTAALTVYDMCKAVQRDLCITDVRLLQKSGGKSGDFQWEGWQHG